MRSLLVLVALMGLGCSVDANALRPVSTDSHAPIKGPGVFDGGADVLPVSPDATPGMDGIAADLLGVAPDLLPPDAGPALDGLARPTDTGPASDLRPATPDVLPAPDLAPTCPFVAWTHPNPASDRWMLTVQIGSDAVCFTACGTLASVFLTPPSSRVTINGVATAVNATETTGYLPAVTAVDGLWVFRAAAGTPTTISLAGWPSNTTGACP